MNILETAKRVFSVEKDALEGISKRLDSNFEEAAKRLYACSGRIVVCGMGKSGLIGKKIAATFASIGQPSIFMHPSEAIHGDLGMLMQGDCFLSISNSGETDELLQLIPHINRLALPHICICAVKNSTLAKHADFVLDIAVEKEASNLPAVPMASAITSLAMGHALAAVLIELSGFRQEDFALYHPGGSLGRKILTKTAELMSRELPVVKVESNLREVISVMSKGMLGLALCLDNNQILGIITDGDLRRALERSGDNEFFKLCAEDIMTKNPKSVNGNQSVLEAEELMNQFKITALVVLENGAPIGVIAKHMFR
jgi:arabinose-5-phosphate isomerase